MEIINGTAIFVGNDGLIFSYENKLLTSVNKYSEEVPMKYSLGQNYPNPFNPSTSIRFDIPKLSNVKITIFNSIGEEVEKLIDEKFSAGIYTIEFDASKYSSGVYYYKLTTSEYQETRKMILVK